VIQAGQKETVTIDEEAVVDVGDAGAFAYDIDGQPGKPLGDKGQVRTMKLTPTSAAQFIR
jgi:hypothetical protein